MTPPALRPFAPLPLAERLFVRGRLFSAPLQEVADRAPAGRIADIGCGHGVLVALLAHHRPDREVVGVDPDPRKISWARASVGQLSNVQLRPGTAQDLVPELEGALDAVVVADVLYLLPVEAWPGFLQAVRSLLKPGGKLLLKETVADGSWKQWKCLLQEQLMVRVLRRTQSSGALGLKPRQVTEQLLRASGFETCEVVNLDRGYSTPHVLFVAQPTDP